MLGVVHCPLPDLTFPDTRGELSARAGIMVVDSLVRLALEDFFCRGTVAFSLGEDLGEVDDAGDVHGAAPIFV
ncbi:hypothetical protein D3C81_2022110 [compost metagenome]